MKVSIKWLDEWIEVADLDPQELAHRLTMAGLEVDAIEEIGAGSDDVVVARIDAIEEHPKADRLVVCKVDDGGDELRTVVCGAKNMKAGDRVPLARPGSSPPGIDFDIGARKVMGIHSQGMLCSAEELGLAEEAEGLMILDDDAPIGEPIFDALELRDTILEIDLTPNRSDCLSHLGVAREVAALYDRELRQQRLKVPEFATGTSATKEAASLEVVDAKGCPHYRLAVVEDVKVTDSPQWLRHRLASVGLRSVNSVVDITNFILMDVGQPLHAFDLDRLEGQKIVVRRAEEGEKLVGIDHGEYELSTDDLVIADASKPVAIAGVMGGADSEVSDKTTRILLECAFFDPTTVRKSAKRHGLHTDSSHRFERGIDAGAVAASMQRALGLLVDVQQEGAGSKPVVFADPLASGTDEEARASIELSARRVSSLLGVEVEAAKCAEYLAGIGVTVEVEESTLSCLAPTYRRDLERPVDLVEEIARLYGYDNIPTTLPRIVAGERHRRSSNEKIETVVSRQERGQLEWVRKFLLGQGFLEAINYSFMGDDDLDRLDLSDDDRRRQAARVANPLVATQTRMRTTLVASLLDNVKTNFARRRHDVALFEMGRRYFPEREVRTLAMVVTGQRLRHWSGEQSWDFYDLKGVVEAAAKPWQVGHTRWSRPEVAEPYLHPGVQAEWFSGDERLGVIGQLHPAVAQKEGLEQSLFFAEIDLEALVACGGAVAVARPAPKFPAVVRDFALLYDDDRPYGDLRNALDELAAEGGEFGQIFEGLELFDVYEGRQVPEGKKSLAIKVTYRSPERTLEEAQVEAADRQLLSHLERKVDAHLR